MAALSPRGCSLFLLTLCLAGVARAQAGGSVRMSGGVSEFVTLSIARDAEASDKGVRVNVSQNAGQSLTVTVSGETRGPTEVRIPVQIRSNAAYSLSAGAPVGGSYLSSLSVVDARPTGNLVDALAVEKLSVAATFDAGRGVYNPTRAAGPNLSSPSELLSGPRVSLGGTLQSPQNALQVTLSLTIEPRGAGQAWTFELLLSAAPTARF
ncbi:MAG TPA: hypothetical protein VNZ44_02595 [Pyrinomonadaceae bacterium]|nr:hypothetical protein [Pyrinomonadaceae bacterium]